MTNQDGARDHGRSAKRWGREQAAPEPARLAARLLTTTLRHREVDAPDEAITRLAADLGAEVGAEATLRPAELALGHASSGVPSDDGLTLRITVRTVLVAYLHLRRDEPFDAVETELLGQAARLISDRLTELSHRVETRALADITTALAVAGDMETGTSSCLDLVRLHTGADGVMLLRDASGELQVLGRSGSWPDARLHDERRRLASTALEGESPMAWHGEEIAYRLGRTRPHRYALLMRFPPTSPLASMRLPGVIEAAETLGPQVEALWRDQVHVELLAFHGGRGEQPTADLYERLLETAIRLTHGADSGSLMIRREETGLFEFQASRGFDQEALEGLTLPPEQVRGWYGLDEAGWAHGRPRILSVDEVDLTSLSERSSPDLERHGSGTERIRSTLCLPVLHGGEVTAVLNLDNQRDAHAFGRDSRAIIDLFAAPLADLLHRQDIEARLRAAALTDPLTGLGNRRPLTMALHRELARHRRSGAPVSVLVMDMSGFKRINDELGHDVGDEALVRVAEALRSELREEDVVSRWGGDEFAALLVDASPEDAARVRERMVAAVHAIEVGGYRLDIAIGAASAPGDGNRDEALLNRADARMYEHKRRTKTRR